MVSHKDDNPGSLKEENGSKERLSFNEKNIFETFGG
jgi:hypothetical protein